MGVRFPRQLFPDALHVSVDVRPLGEHLELHLLRRDLEIADEGIDDAALLLGAAQQEIHGHHLHHLDIAAVPGLDDAVGDLLNGHVIRQGIQGLDHFLPLQEGFVLGDLPLFHIHMEPAAAFGQFLHIRIGGVLLLRPAGEQPLLGACPGLVQHAPVAQIADELEDELGQALAADADEGHQHQGQGGDAQDDDAGGEGKAEPEHRQGGERAQDPGLNGVPGLEHTAHQASALDKIGWDDVDIPFFLSHGFPP